MYGFQFSTVGLTTVKHHKEESYSKPFPFFVRENKVYEITFLIKQLVVNSKKIGGSAAGQTKRIGKNRSLLVIFEYSISHNNRTSV